MIPDILELHATISWTVILAIEALQTVNMARIRKYWSNEMIVDWKVAIILLGATNVSSLWQSVLSVSEIILCDRVIDHRWIIGFSCMILQSWYNCFFCQTYFWMWMAISDVCLGTGREIFWKIAIHSFVYNNP